MEPKGPCVSRMAGGDDCGSVFRALLAFSDGGGFAHQTSGLHTERRGNLNVDEILTSILAPFSGSMAGWSTRTSMSAQEAGSSRNVRNLVSQCVVPRGEGVSARARRRVFAFLVQGGSALGSVSFPVFASTTAVAHGSA